MSTQLRQQETQYSALTENSALVKIILFNNTPTFLLTFINKYTPFQFGIKSEVEFPVAGDC